MFCPSDQTGLLSGQNLSLAGHMPCLLTNIICRLEISLILQSPLTSLLYLIHEVLFFSQVFKHVMKTGGDNCTLTSNEIDFETEELLVGSKVCSGMVRLKRFSVNVILICDQTLFSVMWWSSG